jgi:hypothetical protein
METGMTELTTVLNGNPAVGEGKPTGRKGGDAFILALAIGCSVPQAAERAGIGTSTAYRRLDDPELRRAVSRVRDELLGQAVGRLLAVAGKAIDTLEASLQSYSDSVRVRAALGILANMLRGIDTVELARRLTELEEQHQGSTCITYAVALTAWFASGSNAGGNPLALSKSLPGWQTRMT